MEPDEAPRPGDEAFLKKYGNYQPVQTRVPVSTVRPLIAPIIGGETPEEQARRAAIEARAQTGERREDVRLGLAISAQQLAQQSQQLAQQGRQESLSKEQFDRVSKLRTEFQAIPDVKDFIGIKNSTRQIVELAKGEGSPMGEIASVFLIMKALDPASVVREGEFATVQNATSVAGRFANYYNKILKGQGLSPEQREDMARTALSIYNQRKLGYDEFAGTYRNLLEKEGANPDEQGVTAAPVLEFQPKPLPSDGEKATSTSTFAPLRPGEPVQTEADLAAERQLQSAWDSGASVDQMVALMQQLGRGAFEPAAIQQMQNARAKGERVRMYATPTGKPTAFEEQVTGAMATPVGQAAGGVALGAANALTLGMIDELAPVIGLSSEQVQAAKNYYRQEAPIASFTGEVAGAVGASVPFVRGAQAALAGTRLAGAAPLIGEALYGAGYGAGEAPEDQRLMGATIGGVSAGLGGALANRFLPGAPGTFTGIAPELPPAGRFAGPALPPSEIIAAGREAGVPVMTGDINPPQTFMGRVGQQITEIVPFGTAGMRRTQQEARERAVEDLLAETNVTLDRDVATDIVQNLKETRSKEIDKWNDMKTNVIEKYTTAGDVAAPKSLDAIDSLIAKLQGENLPRQLGGLIQQLNDVKTSLSGPGNLQKIEANRKTLFDLKADPNLANILTKSEKAFQQVYKALNDDMGDFIKTTGNNKDFTRWKVANTKLALMAGELRQVGLKRVLDQGEFNPQTVTGMLTSTNPQEAKLLYDSLGSAGRANARLLLLQGAAKKALDPNTGVINPNTFAREANRLKSNFGQFFSGAEANRVQGLVAVLNATRRAQESQFAPRTGERLVPFATAGSFGWLGTLLGFDPITGLASSAGVGAAARLYESAATRDMLIRIGKASGSEKARLISDFTQRMTAAAAPVAAVGAANMNEPSGPPEGAIIVGPKQ